MSNRARFETTDGEHLRISRGTLMIFKGETGEYIEFSLSGEMSYDPKKKKLVVPIYVKSSEKLITTTFEYNITKGPEQFRKEMLETFIATEKSRLVNKVKSLPETVDADPSGTGGSPNPEFEKARSALSDFCVRYGLDFYEEMGWTRPKSEKSKKKAKA